MGEEEVKRLHTQYRLQLAEHIETCMQHLPHHFPGFQRETIYGERGWAALAAVMICGWNPGASERAISAGWK